jgi:PAS domain S-box-containing protein
MNPVDVRNASILIVDDQEANVILLEQLLRDDGYTRITTTGSPESVSALHQQQHFDLILLDLQLPGMDGFDVMKALKTSVIASDLSVIVLTAQPGHKLRALQAGAKDFISKPFDPVEVKTRIHNVLEVRLLYKELEDYVKELEHKVQQRTAALQESEMRFRGLTELASDWYWEQDDQGNFTRVYGPVLEMLGIEIDSRTGVAGDSAENGWNAAERAALQAKIASHESFLDFTFSRSRPDGSQQLFRVSGQPMFDRACTFLGYRGIGMEITTMNTDGHVEARSVQ